MAAGRHIGFPKFRISDEIFQFLLCQGICSSNFSQKAQSTRQLLTFGKSNMAVGRHLGFSKLCISDEIFQFLLCQGICSSNFSQKAQSMRKLLTFW